MSRQTPRIRKIGRVRKAGPINVTRAEFDSMIKLLNERGEIINEIRRELESEARQTRHDLDVQFRRIAQLQAELDEIKRAWARITPV